jgi:hypothetical protein
MLVINEVKSGEQQRVQARSYRNQGKRNQGWVSRLGFPPGPGWQVTGPDQGNWTL